jgi:hypothetical protein
MVTKKLFYIEEMLPAGWKSTGGTFYQEIAWEGPCNEVY